MRGDGRIFRQKGSSYWWCAYYLHGKEHRESSKSTDRAVAVRLLRRRLKEVGAAQLGAWAFAGPKAERITVAQLLEALRADKLRRGRRDPASEMHMLGRVWGQRLAISVTGPDVAAWTDQLAAQGYRPASINRFTQLLAQAYRLGRENGLVVVAPVIKRLSETDNVRTGLFTSAQFDRLIAELPAYLQDFASWARCTGWRAGSIRSLRWDDVEDDRLRVQAQYSKDRTSHVIPLVSPLREIVERRRALRTGPYVFSYPNGAPIGSYKTAWRASLRRAGLPAGLLFHDLRRVAATELRRAGVPEDVAMQITGHKTRAMFSRYNIVDLGDMERALQQRATYLQQLAAQPTATARVQ